MNNLTLDVLIGLVLIYLVFSIIVSALTEYFANGFFGRRPKNLKQALQSAFGSKSKSSTEANSLVDKFLNNGLILTLYQGKAGPSSIPDPIFAKGFIATLQQAIKLSDRTPTPAEFVSKLNTELDDSLYKTKPELLQTLQSLLKGNESNWDGFEKSIADWFAEVGERSTGWYKRGIEIWKLGIAMALVALLNIDSILIFKVLSIDSRSRQELNSTAIDVLTTAKAIADNDKSRQVLTSIAPASPMQNRIEVDIGLARTLGLLRNHLIDNKSFLKYVQSRCTGSLDSSSHLDKTHCDADLMKWYPDIENLRRNFSDIFQRIDCEQNIKCTAEAQKVVTQIGAKYGVGRDDVMTANTPPDQILILQKIIDQNKTEISIAIGKINAADDDLTRLQKISREESFAYKYAGINDETISRQEIIVNGIKDHIDAIIRKIDGTVCKAAEAKCKAIADAKDKYKTVDSSLLSRNLLNAQQLIRAQAALAPPVDGVCDALPWSPSADQLKSCINKLVGVTNNLNLVLGVPADVDKDNKARKMMEDIVAALTQARVAAEKQIPEMGAYSERLCSKIGEKYLSSSAAKDKPTPDGIAQMELERRTCADIFKRTRQGELGLPLTWDPDLRMLRFYMYSPGARDEDVPRLNWETMLYFAQIFAGWLLTAIALSLGSEFWFNALGGLVAIRLSGARRALVQDPPPPPTQGGTNSPAMRQSDPSGGPSYFPNALTDAEGRLTSAQITRIQGIIGMKAPLTGELDNKTRQAIHDWHRQRGGADTNLWQLEERHIKELLSGQPTPLDSVLPGGVQLLPGASASPFPQLKIGSNGEDVRQFKTLLSSTPQANGKPYLPSAEVDANFDESTQRATENFQSTHGLSQDGIAGPATWLRMTSDIDRLPARLREHPWMCHAIHEINQTEIPGRASSNPRIEEYQKTTNITEGDDVAWCSSFAKWVLTQAGIKTERVTGFASSWCAWGQADPLYTFGSIIVVKKKGTQLQASGAGAHVGFLVQVNDGRIFILGGNQGDPGAVNVSAFPENAWEILAVRQPADADFPANQNADEKALANQAGPNYPYFSVFPERPYLKRGSMERQAVAKFQDMLNQKLQPTPALTVDGIFGPKTEAAVRDLQKFIGLPNASGVVDEGTWSALDAASLTQNSAAIVSTRLAGASGLNAFVTKNGLTMAHVLAVREVESNGAGMVTIATAPKPKILFEGHQFYRLLKASGITDSTLSRLLNEQPSIIYPNWTRSHYLTSVGEWSRLEEARKICVANKAELKLPACCSAPGDIANMAASWGLFQIMGFNWKLCGCNDVANFVTQNEVSEDAQIELFVTYLTSNQKMIEALQNQNWAGFAEAYNGPGFRENRYDFKLKQAFDKFST